MIGSFLTRTLVLIFGYAYPAYECFKVVELNKPEIEQLRFWCQYWILVAALTVFERVGGDTFISWLPMYSEAKLAFFVYLWYPKTKGTMYVYDTFFRPYVAKHETEIDRNLFELRTRAGDILVVYWQKAASYGQTRFFDILQYVASQSQSQPPRPRTVQHRQQHQQTPQELSTGSVQPQALSQPQQPARQPVSPTKSHQEESANTSIFQPAALIVAQRQNSAVSTTLPTSETTRFPPQAEVEQVQVEASSVPSNKDSKPELQETPMEEAVRVTRARLRKRAASGAAVR